MLFPTDVAGMGVWDAGEPVIIVAFLLDFCLAVRGSPIPATSVRVDARVSGITQDTDSGRSGQRPEHRGTPVRRNGKPRPSFRNAFTVWHAEPTRKKVSKK